MLNIGNKTFMNLQEAVGWLLENNALPFQSTANYAGGVEIAMSTLINPSPAKVRVGSIIFFADSKVSTVVGVTSNSFIVSDQYNDLVDDVVYVSNVAINASGHLIVTLSNGTDIDAGLIRQISSFSINSSQHLIAVYNDGSVNDLGAIFSGDITISGNLTVTGSIYGVKLEDIKDANAHNRFIEGDISTFTPAGVTFSYAKWSLSGTHLMLVLAGTIASGTTLSLGAWGDTSLLPKWVADKVYPVWSSIYIESREINLYGDDWSTQTTTVNFQKVNTTTLRITNLGNTTLTTDRHFRIQFDLLIDNQ